MFNRAEMFNYRARHPKFKADEIIRKLALRKRAVVADIGSGGGYFAIRFAETVGLDGKIYAIDTNPKFLSHIAKVAGENKLTNIETISIKRNGLNLPEQSCDLIFLRNVFHHLDDPVAYFKTLKRFLKPGGKVAVIDYKKPKSFSFISLLGHYVEEGLILETMKKAGYEPVECYDFLPEQSFNIFS